MAIVEDQTVKTWGPGTETRAEFDACLRVGPDCPITVSCYGNGAQVAIGGFKLCSGDGELTEAHALDVLAAVCERMLAAVNECRSAEPQVAS